MDICYFVDTYYVYTARIFDTVYSVANYFGISEQQLRAANSQWDNKGVIYLQVGEEVILPPEVEKSPMFFLVKWNLKQRQHKPADLSKTPKTYAADWFPPKPSFGSPSSPLSSLLSKLGNPKYTVVNPGTYHSPIKFTDGWGGKNVSTVEIPQLNNVPYYSIGNKTKCKGKISFYTKAHKAVQELFNAWEEAGLIGKILTYEGSYNPRVIKSTLTPSNHSFGTAFDINGSWNKEGKAPAGIGKTGCLLELVPIAGDHGFYWGGFYKDGMHFEYAKL